MGRFSSGKMNVFDGEHFESEAFDEMEFEGTPETFTVFVPTDMVNLSRVPDEYDYDMETSHNTFFWDELLPTLIVYCLTFVLGLVGNVLIIFTIFRYRKMKSTTNVFLASLASSDLLLILFCIPVKGSEKPAPWSQMHIKNRGITSRGYSSHKPKILTKYDTERLKLIHRLDCEFANPFSSKSSSPMEQVWKKSPVESSVRNANETDKLSVMEMSVLHSNVSSQVQGLKYKLPKEMNQHSEFIKKLSEPREESLEDFKMVKSSNSDSKIMKWGAEYGKTSDHATDLVLVYPFWKKLLKMEKPVKYKSVHHKHSSHRSRKYKKNSHETSTKYTAGKCLNSTEHSTDSSNSVDSCQQKSKRKQYCRTEHKMNSVDVSCCEECICLKRRVNCLEKEVEKIKKKISCIDSQTSTGEICKIPEMNIKSPKECKHHQRSCRYRHEEKQTHFHHHQQQQQQQQNEREKVACYPTKTTSFETIVHNSKNRDVRLKSSTSDCHLNVGMEIKMENVDPVTGKKLQGEVRKDFQQDGNIQCRLFEEGQAPILVLDTDFQYNPHTGMLFKNQKTPNATSHSTNIILPLKSSKERKASTINSNRKFSKSQISPQTFPCAQNISEKTEEKKADSRKCMSLEQNQLDRVDQCPHHKSKKSQSLESTNNNSLEKKQCSMEEELKMDLSLEEKESKTSAALKEKLSKSELQQRSRSSSARSKSCRKPKNGKSLIPTRRRPTPSRGRKNNSKIIESSWGWRGTTKRAITDKELIDKEFIWYMDTANSLPRAAPIQDTADEASDNERLNPWHDVCHQLAKLFSFTWTFGFFLCKLVHYMQSVSAICSVLTLTAMSLERYYAIVHPMKAQYICTISQARRIITGTWVSAFLLAVPILFAQVHLRVGVKVEAYWCVRDWDNKIVWRAHELYMFLLILIVPTGVMAVAYTAICWEIWEVMQRRQDMTSGKEQGFCKKPVRNSSTESFPSFIYTNNPSKLGNKKRGRALLKKELADDTSSVKQVIKMLVAVIVIYVLCWGPMLIDNVLQAYGILSHIRMGWLKYMGTAFHLMAYFNSCINPIIYGFMSKNFRDSFRKTLCCMGRKQKMALRSFSLSQTRNTSIRYAESSFGRTVSIALPV